MVQRVTQERSIFKCSEPISIGTEEHISCITITQTYTQQALRFVKYHGSWCLLGEGHLAIFWSDRDGGHGRHVPCGSVGRVSRRRRRCARWWRRSSHGFGASAICKRAKSDGRLAVLQEGAGAVHVGCAFSLARGLISGHYMGTTAT